MREALRFGSPPIDVDLRRSAQARRMSLRVSRLDGQVRLSIPKRLPLREAEAFLREREGWLRAQLAQIDAPRMVQMGDRLSIAGRELLLQSGAVRAPRIEDTTLILPQARAIPALRAYLREEARRHLVAQSDLDAAALGLGYNRITLRDTRSRWGSCSSRGDLMYSWRLVLAPVPVMRYVVAHEVAHLREMNHAPAFWAVVQQLDPNWRSARDWLRDHGAGLHRLRFDA